MRGTEILRHFPGLRHEHMLFYNLLKRLVIYPRNKCA